MVTDQTVGLSWDDRFRDFDARDRRKGKKASAGGPGKVEEILGLETVGELLTWYPRRYLDLDAVDSVHELVAGEQASVVVEVVGATVHTYQDKRTGKRRFRTEVETRLAEASLWMTFFDPYESMAKDRVEKLHRGRRVVASGRAEQNRFKKQRWELIQPFIDEAETGFSLLPVYKVGGALTADEVRKVVRPVLDIVTDVPERIPTWLRDEHGLLDAATAIRWIHRPEDRRQVGAATKRLKFDEALVTQVAFALRRREQAEVAAEPRTGRDGGAFDAFDARMPFDLTAGQRAVEEEILADLARPHPMRRLLQGEVGSGKTVVSLRAMLRVVDSGGQAALLAPTEVLAQQHHRSLTRMLGDLAKAGELGADDAATKVALLTGSMPAAARRAVLLEIASGEAGIVIGTHALLEDVVQFADLGLVVVDEQHRFGVEQRAALAAKGAGRTPHELVMTATPIPRTVAMTVFGDLETSSLTELPAGRSPIQTTVVPLADQPAWFDRVWARVREEVAKGHQVYVVCPRISGDDKDDDEVEPPLDEEERKGPPLAAVEEVAPALEEGPLAGLRVGVLHGRMAPEAKDATMQAFAAGDVDVLVSTTVIEVGVDVGNATAMVLLDADRFGISQLHQLRGRVGRGGHPGLCLLVTGARAGSGARTRLDAVASTTDGFRLAELDLELRREGDVLGSRQSGARGGLQLLSVVKDGDVIEAARAAAARLVDEDPVLEGSPALRREVERLLRSDMAEYLDKA
ncbi:ATP-dependent DNA helicase RecG [Nocardioides caldifontis]|uniref:ATP-dependent DNA helicase RecG n=1 Tax=Nocardioides caldifontis TaxID=2588938 RepID=UPI0011DFDFAE|nr:ATP-dependent DNA helicase RecG [Nocardioides caldifontis]